MAVALKGASGLPKSCLCVFLHLCLWAERQKRGGIWSEYSSKPFFFFSPKLMQPCCCINVYISISTCKMMTAVKPSETKCSSYTWGNLFCSRFVTTEDALWYIFILEGRKQMYVENVIVKCQWDRPLYVHHTASCNWVRFILKIIIPKPISVDIHSCSESVLLLCPDYIFAEQVQRVLICMRCFFFFFFNSNYYYYYLRYCQVHFFVNWQFNLI